MKTCFLSFSEPGYNNFINSQLIFTCLIDSEDIILCNPDFKVRIMASESSGLWVFYYI